jgi:hypothetical protein
MVQVVELLLCKFKSQSSTPILPTYIYTNTYVYMCVYIFYQDIIQYIKQKLPIQEIQKLSRN